MALMQDDIKKVLAYSSISQMGYILFGLGSENIFGDYWSYLDVCYSWPGKGHLIHDGRINYSSDRYKKYVETQEDWLERCLILQ